MLAHEHTDVRSTVSHNTCFYQDFTPSDIPHQLAVSPQQVIRLLLLLILAVSRRGRFPLPPAAKRRLRSRRTLAPRTQIEEMADCPNRMELRIEERVHDLRTRHNEKRFAWTQGSGA